MTVRELITRFGIEADQEQLKRIEKGVDNIKFGLLGIVGAAATAGVAIWGIVKTSANAADRIYDMAYAAGVDAQSLQRLGHAAQISGSNINDMANGLRFLSRSMSEARENIGSEQAQTFRRLGIDIFTVAGRAKTADQVFVELANRFQVMPDRARKTAIAMELLGRSGGNLVQTLDQGGARIAELAAELDAFGGVMDESTLEKLGQFNDSWDRTWAVLNSIKKLVASTLAPLFTKMLDDFREFLIVNKEIIKQNLLGFLRGIASVTRVMWEGTRRLAEAFMFLASKVGGVEVMTKLLLYTVLLLGSAATITGIVQLTRVVWSLGRAILAALTPLFLKAAAIVAVVGLILLAFEDVVAYFQGRKSVTAVIVRKFGEAWEWIKRKSSDFMDWLLMKTGQVVEWVNSKLAKLFRPVEDSINWVIDKMNQLGLGGPAGIRISQEAAATGSVTGITPGTSPLSNDVYNVTINAQNTVNVPQSLGPAQAADRLELGVQQGIEGLVERIFRPAQRATAPSMVR